MRSIQRRTLGRIDRRSTLVASIGLALTACAVGPDFKPPEAPQVGDADRPYTPSPMPLQTAGAPVPGGAPQRFLTGEDISALWWEAFRSEPLDQLIRSALKRSPTLASAQAALREAQASYEATWGSTLLPNVNGQLSATRQRASLTSFGLLGTAEFDLYTVSVNGSYTIDAFGAARRELEGLRAAIDYQRYQVEAAYLSLTANLVTTAIQEASIRAQLQATQDVLAAESQTLSIVEKQQALGAVAYTAVITQRTQVAQTRALLPALEKSLAQTRHLLAVYAGQLPSEAGLPEFSLESLQLPHDLPVSLPSSLVRQRPDIRASEAQLHQANAQVGVATANLYPQITLSASTGQQSVQTNDLFSNSNFTWSLGAGLLQPIFQGGALRARKRAAIAAFDAAQAQYQQTVLNAFLDVANTLRALDIDADALRVQAQSESLARESLDLVTRQYELGAASYLQLLDSQRTYQQAKVGLVQAQAARYADTAALFQALGGGWWNRPPLAEATGRP
ncbi:MAG TPA: efflux transporter outer membrane subunit [Steroidobacter sp.]|nr:efflux transporter outer membrane subunit [Steroidobacter sp.]